MSGILNLVGAICWNLITWYFTLPSSSSHALIGGVVGAGLVAAGGGSAIAFGLALLGLARAEDTHGASVRVLNYTMSAVCGLYVAAAIVFGLYAMLHK